MAQTSLNILQGINSPDDLKQLSIDQLPELCQELRTFIIDELSQNPGHLGASLGVVELSVALHYVFNTPYDRIIWDVGHQAYAHKILTGRRERFHTNRQFGGISGFPTPKESEYDSFGVGHSSTSISAGLGMSIAAYLHKEDRQVVAVIGDGAMTGGLAFEGLNNASINPNNLLIILNDNHMAIDPIRGGLSKYLGKIHLSPTYNRLRFRTYKLLRRMHVIDESNKGKIIRFANSLKSLRSNTGNNIFEGLSIRYFGPVDGHNVELGELCPGIEVECPLARKRVVGSGHGEVRPLSGYREIGGGLVEIAGRDVHAANKHATAAALLGITDFIFLDHGINTAWQRTGAVV